MGKFTENDIALAKEVQEKYGVPASVTLAQYALESGYGKSTVGKNNYFNIKGNGTGGYRDYSSKEESFLDYGELLSNDRYTSHTKDAQNLQEYVQGIKDAGYAEDPNYVSKLVTIITANNLTQYDTNSYNIPTGKSNASDTNIFGSVATVIFTILVVVVAIVFLGLAVTTVADVDVESMIKKKVKKVL